MFGISKLAIIPLRAESSHRSEIVSQLLFGEHFQIMEVSANKEWHRIKNQFDGYEGWIDSKQSFEITEDEFENLSAQASILTTDLIEYVAAKDHLLTTVPLGSLMNFLSIDSINLEQFVFEGQSVNQVQDKAKLIDTAFLYLNTPYLWGGRTPFGIDCSGFTQMVYKLNGFKLERDASQQALQGEPLSFIEESEAGDLAFFDNDEGVITHVGIIMQDNYIIHSSGKVRIDRLDHLGIFNPETQRHTHKLRVIKKYL